VDDQEVLRRLAFCIPAVQTWRFAISHEAQRPGMSFFEELKRRNVFRAAIAYAVVAWIVLQVADFILENVGAPQWTQQTVLVLLLLGFPVAMLLAWIYELTPSGPRREEDLPARAAGADDWHRAFDRIVVVLIGIAVVMLLLDEFLFE
jgi:hypothetical protein